MAAQREQLIWPGTQQFERLSDFRDKFKAAADALLWEEDHDNREYVKAMLEQEVFYWRAYCVLHDPEWDMRMHLRLPDKNKNIVPHEMKPIQRRVHEYIERKKNDKGPTHPYGDPIQAIGPKSRRHGLTQQISAEDYLWVRNEPYCQAVIMAHRDDAAAAIFKKYETYYANDDPSLRPPPRRGNKGEMLFGEPHNGWIKVFTAGIQEAGQGHGDGNHIIHISEESRFRHVNPSELVTGLIATVPGPNEAMSMIWRESTGFGQHGSFFGDVMTTYKGVHTKHDWLKHSSLWESLDDGGWDVIFASSIDRYDAWLSFNHDTTCRAVTDPAFLEAVALHLADCKCKTLHAERRAMRKSFTDEEKNFHEKCGASEEWIKWYRYTFERETKAIVDMGARRRKMRETQAVELMDCFQATGSTTFDLDRITELTAMAPESQGYEIHSPIGSLFSDVTHRFERQTPTPTVLVRNDGWLRVVERRLPGKQYCFGVDTAEGTAKGDFSTVYGINQHDRTLAFWGEVKMSLSAFCDAVRLISREWNDAFILPEVNFNKEFVRWLASCDRKNFLPVRINPSATDATNAEQMQHGFRSTMDSKVGYVTTLKLVMEHEPQLLACVPLLEQMQLFREELTADGRTKIKGAGNRDHDDLVTAAGLCVTCDQWQPARRIRVKGEPRDDGLPPLSTDNPSGHFARMVQAADRQRRMFDGLKRPPRWKGRRGR